MSTTSYWKNLGESRLSRRRAILGASGAGAGALLLAACGGSDSKSGGGEKAPGTSSLTTNPLDSLAQAKSGGVLKDFQIRGDPIGFDGVATNSAGVNTDGYPRLLKFITAKYPKDAPGGVEGDIAESFELSPDKSQFTVKLRPGLKWDSRAPTSGRVIDSQDILFCWEKYAKLNPSAVDIASSRAPSAPVESMTAPDANTIVMKLKVPDSSILQNFAASDHFVIMPRESGGGFDPRSTVRGYGPYTLEEYTPSVRLVWARNPDYHVKGRPFPDKIEKPIVPDYSTRLSQFRAGAIWVGDALQQDVIQTKRDTPAVLMLQAANYNTMANYISFGYEGNSPFKDARVRQALSMLIDRESFADVIEERESFRKEGIELPVRFNAVVCAGFAQWLDPTNDKEFGPNNKYLKYNKDEALKLLTAASYAKGFDFEFTFNSDTNYTPPYLKIIELLQGMWADGGVNGKSHGIKYTEFYDNYIAAYALGNTKGFNGAMSRGGRGGVSVASFLFGALHKDGQLFHGQTPDGKNASQGDPKVNDAIEKIRQEFDAAKQETMVKDLIRYYTGQMYTITRPSLSKGFELYWPAVGNAGVTRSAAGGNLVTENRLDWWVDSTKAPLAKS